MRQIADYLLAAGRWRTGWRRRADRPFWMRPRQFEVQLDLDSCLPHCGGRRMWCQKRDLAFGVAGVTVVVITPRQV